MTTCNLHGDCGCECKVYTHADYKALEAKCESLEYHGRKMAEENGSLTAELAECRKDANRYLHLKNELDLSDEAIDNAIARTQPK